MSLETSGLKESRRTVHRRPDPAFQELRTKAKDAALLRNCGRAAGFSFLGKPPLETGDEMILQPGMVLIVDGSVSPLTFRAQVGDRFIITEHGWEAVADHPKDLDNVILLGV